MIRLTLKDKTILRFNLKSFEREKSMHDAWYSMADMPRYHKKVLKFHTDQGHDYSYRIEEIESCDFLKKMFEYDTPEIEKAKPKVFENSILNQEASTSTEKISSIANNPEIHDILQKIAELFSTLMESIPEKHRRNATLFMTGLKENHIPIDMNDQYLSDVLMQVMDAEESDIPKYVEMYIEYWRKNYQ